MIHLKGKDRGLVVVSNRLPFHKYEAEDGSLRWAKAAGGLITGLEPILLKLKGTWLGWDGTFSEGAGNDFKLVDSSKLMGPEAYRGTSDKSYTIGNVPITPGEYEQYYNRFSNGTLWALFHYFFEKCFLDYSCWDTYCRVNERFARYADRVAGDNDIIWVQDFHLFMVPYYLRKMRPDQEIHFFLHIPFPHLDIFSILPWQERILESLLCCNTIGFHHKQYFRNFMGAVGAYRKQRKADGRHSLEEKVTTHGYSNPISIDFELIDATSRQRSVVKRKKQIIEQASCPKIIIGVDRIDYSKGIKERLLGLEHLLKEHPELKEQFFYYQLVVPSREDVKTYQDLKKEIDQIMGRINGAFATGLWTPVHYNYGKVPFQELVALYSAADVALVTPLRDGMNLVCKEYIASHSDNDGVLVLSKFAGAIAEIKNCLPVNPYSIEDIANAIYQGLHMPKDERRKRMKKMRKNVSSNNINSWLDTCVRNFELS
ncbi:MAG: trehalose-6-phosphate synthase [Candidatus Omnitrophica bacterium]|nr:trehalose-6-phosphate synthase [Candidatus Omnitrophota bacterium]